MQRDLAIYRSIEPYKVMNTDSQKLRSFVAAISAAGYGQRNVPLLRKSYACRILRMSFVLIGLPWALSSQAEDIGFPMWLGGKPDVEIKADRCGVYEWFLDEADSQTEGIASKDELASTRLINIANKLVEHHLSSPADSYSAEVKYLVIGYRGPFHFEFQISSTELERIMTKDCVEYTHNYSFNTDRFSAAATSLPVKLSVVHHDPER